MNLQRTRILRKLHLFSDWLKKMKFLQEIVNNSLTKRNKFILLLVFLDQIKHLQMFHLLELKRVSKFVALVLSTTNIFHFLLSKPIGRHAQKFPTCYQWIIPKNEFKSNYCLSSIRSWIIRLQSKNLMLFQCLSV
jgi:hypothetical protein